MSRLGNILRWSIFVLVVQLVLLLSVKWLREGIVRIETRAIAAEKERQRTFFENQVVVSTFTRANGTNDMIVLRGRVLKEILEGENHGNRIKR